MLDTAKIYTDEEKAAFIAENAERLEKNSSHPEASFPRAQERRSAFLVKTGDRAQTSAKAPIDALPPADPVSLTMRDSLYVIPLHLVSEEEAERRRVEERRRVKAVRAEKAKASKKRVTMTTVKDGNSNRSVKKIRTTADKMLTSGSLPKYLKTALDAFSIMVADGWGVATEEGHDSTSRQTCTYEPMTGSGYASKTLSDRQLDGLAAWRILESRMPEELKPTFCQLIGEETGNLTLARRTQSEIGESRGFKYKQASSAGAMEIICVCMLINHYLKEKAQNIGTN